MTCSPPWGRHLWGASSIGAASLDGCMAVMFLEIKMGKYVLHARDRTEERSRYMLWNPDKLPAYFTSGKLSPPWFWALLVYSSAVDLWVIRNITVVTEMYMTLLFRLKLKNMSLASACAKVNRMFYPHWGKHERYVTVINTARLGAVHTFLWFVIYPTLLMSNTDTRVNKGSK